MSETNALSVCAGPHRLVDAAGGLTGAGAAANHTVIWRWRQGSEAAMDNAHHGRPVARSIASAEGC